MINFFSLSVYTVFEMKISIPDVLYVSHFWEFCAKCRDWVVRLVFGRSRVHM